MSRKQQRQRKPLPKRERVQTVEELQGIAEDWSDSLDAQQHHVQWIDRLEQLAWGVLQNRPVKLLSAGDDPTALPEWEPDYNDCEEREQWAIDLIESIRDLRLRGKTSPHGLLMVYASLAHLADMINFGVYAQLGHRQSEGGRAGFETRFGTDEERQAKYREWQAALDQILAKNPWLSHIQAAKIAIKRFGFKVKPDTFTRHTTRPK
jgi:hypothetical protein